MEQITRDPLRKFWLYLPFAWFVIAVLCMCFAYGVAVGKWQIFPHNFLNAGWDSLRELRKAPPNKAPHYLHPARYEGAGIVECESEHVSQGVTLISGAWRDMDDWHWGVRLIDLDGEVLHEWRMDAEDIWERSPHNDYQAQSKVDKTVTYVHGLLLLPNGDIVFNLEFFSLVRMNSNSEVVWKLPYRTHHSIFEDSEGSYWACGSKWVENNIPEYVGLKPPFIEDMIVKVSPEGVIEREISLLEVIYKSGYDGILRVYHDDILHLNDVEVLSEQIADAFDLFQAGDIMVSMRTINTILVIDGKTERIKWSLTYPFIGQHDPDFTPDGYITVFDNHSDWEADRFEGQGSRIIRIEPSTKKVTTFYGWKENQYFFTFRCGKHQHLPNGNMLITESQAGRVFEITANGEVVWSWIAPRWDENNVPEILEGTRYGTEYANFVSGLRKDEK
jgi:hypothetical protein